MKSNSILIFLILFSFSQYQSHSDNYQKIESILKNHFNEKEVIYFTNKFEKVKININDFNYQDYVKEIFNKNFDNKIYKNLEQYDSLLIMNYKFENINIKLMNDSLFLNKIIREININFYYEFFSSENQLILKNQKNLTSIDTLNFTEINNLSNFEPSNNKSKIFEPIIIYTTSLAMIVLLFFLRTN